MKQFDLDKWLTERYSPLTLERIKKAHFNYDDVLEILNAALRQTPVVGRIEQLKAFVDEFIESWEDGNAGDSDLYRKAKSL
jgi:phosphoserine phosphatase